jgi:uncharacterized membrane protein YkvA (DUF1232 family)
MMFRSLATSIRLATRPGAPSMGARIGSLPRLVRATLDGRYKGASLLRLAGMAAAVLYIVSPVDLLPESFLLLAGLTDDAVAATWLASTLIQETERFLEWEQATAGSPAPGRPVTVRSRVVDPG